MVLVEGSIDSVQKSAQEGPIFATPNNIMAELPRFELLPEQFLSKHCRDMD